MSCMFSLVLPGIPFLNWQDGVLKERSHLTCRGNWSLNSEMQKKMERGVQDAREERVKQKRDSSNLPRVPLHLWPNLIISSCARNDPTISFVVQSLSRVWLFVTPWTAPHQASLSFTSPGTWPHPCPLSQWCHPTISSSVIIFFSCPQSFPASGSFPMSQFFPSGGQSIQLQFQLQHQSF